VVNSLIIEMIERLNFYCKSSLVVIVFAISACGVSNSATANNQTRNSRNMNESTAKLAEVKTSIEELEKQINLPVRPSEVKWMAETFDNSKGTVPGPSDYRLTALLKYDEKSAVELVKKLEAENAGNTDVKNWFPDEVKNSAKTVDGKTFLEGAKYSPNSFFRGSYKNGNLIRVGETNYFVLNLFSF